MIKAICQGEISLVDTKLPCYVLEDKTRVLSQGGLVQSLGKSRATNLAKFLESQSAGFNIDKDLIALAKNPIVFIPPHGGNPAYGYNATILVDICDTVLEARKNQTLPQTQSYQKLVNQCEILIRSFAKTGIIALIDEATGYEKIRETGELIKFFKETMVREIASDKIKEFEKRGIFDGLYKIYKLPRKKDKPWQHPSFFGHFFIKYIYKPLDTIITDGQAKTRGIMLKLLKEKKDLNSGTMLYQFIAEVGEAQFFEHLRTISNLMKIADNKKQFDILFDKVFGNIIQDDLFPEPQLLELFEPEKKQEESEEGKIIKSIKKDHPKLENKGFEDKLKNISIKN